MPGLPLFVLTHRPPELVPAGEPPCTFVTDGIEIVVEQARAAADGQNVSTSWGRASCSKPSGPASSTSW